MSKQLLMGNEAIGLAAILSGVNVVTGYPGTPSSEIIETIAQYNPGDIHVEWSTNEKVALEVAAGASYSGARTLTTMKQVGLNVAMDPLMSLNYVGTEGGMVIVVADDPGPISSQTEQDTRDLGRFAHVPVFDPGTPEDAFYMVDHAFQISEKYKTPVILRPTTRVNHGSSTIDINLKDIKPNTRNNIAGFKKDPRFVIFPKRSYQGHIEIIERLQQIANDFSTSTYQAFNRVRYYQNFQTVTTPKDTSTYTYALITGGVSTGYTAEAINILAEKINTCDALNSNFPKFKTLSVGTAFPFPEKLILKFLEGVEHVICFEELSPYLEQQLLMTIGKHKLNVTVHGKLDNSTKLAGENTPHEIANQLIEFFELPGLSPLDEKEYPPTSIDTSLLPVRPPTLCPGCSHRGAFHAIKTAVGRKYSAIYAGDIGCYTLGNAAPLNTTDTCLCMGGGFTVAQGLALANNDPKTVVFGFVGDSTYFASGLPGVANAVYNNHNVVLVVLDNSTTAMTGNQPHPGTGVNLMDATTEPINIHETLSALGVKTIINVDPLDKTASIHATKKAIEAVGVSALIFESPCINLFKPLEPAWVEPDECRSCRICVDHLGCPALLYDNNKAHIDSTLCNGCDLCVQECPFGAIHSPRENLSYPERHALRGADTHA